MNLSMNKALIVQNLNKKYHTLKEEIEAVKDFSLELNSGEFVAIVGPSGCGKSTILNILSGVENESSGDIKLADNKLACMLQQDALFDWLTVLDNCLLGVRLKKEYNEDVKKYVLTLLDNYGLKDFVNYYPSSLSGGMRQRVALIRTLAMKPDILLLDEPFSALDYYSRLLISKDVYMALRKENKSMIMVTHDIAEAISMCDRVIVLTSRPAVIKREYKIELTNCQNPIANRQDPKFNYYYDMIWKDIDSND